MKDSKNKMASADGPFKNYYECLEYVLQILLIIISFIIHWFMALVTIIFFLICYILMLSDQIYVRFKSNKVSLLIYKIYKLLRKKII